MNVKTLAENDAQVQITIRFDGGVRHLADGYAGSFEFDDTDTEAFERFNTRLAVRTNDEIDAAREVLDAVERDEDLKTNQKSALRRVRSALESARGHVWDAERKAELAEDDENTAAVATDGGDDEAEQDELTEDEADELENTVVAAKGVKAGFRTSTPYARQADDGRVFVRFTTSHKYGRSNGLAELNDESDREFVLAYSPHGPKHHVCEPAEGMSEDEAAERLAEGVDVVLPDGSTGTVTECDYFTKLDGASASFGQIHTSRLVEHLAAGVASFVADETDDEDEEQDDEQFVSVPFDGAVRKMAEGEARVAAMYGDELATEAFGRFSTVVRVRSADEAAAVWDVLDRVQEHEDLKTNQNAAVRRVKARMVSAEATLLDTAERSHEAAQDEQADEGEQDEDETRLITDGGVDTVRLGCPHCETVDDHRIIARPAAECDEPNSLPDGVMLCSHCDEQFDDGRALEPTEPTNEFDSLDAADAAGARDLYDALDEANTDASVKAVRRENALTDDEARVSIRLSTRNARLDAATLDALADHRAEVEHLGESGQLLGDEWLVYLPA